MKLGLIVLVAALFVLLIMANGPQGNGVAAERDYEESFSMDADFGDEWETDEMLDAEEDFESVLSKDEKKEENDEYSKKKKDEGISDEENMKITGTHLKDDPDSTPHKKFSEKGKTHSKSEDKDTGSAKSDGTPTLASEEENTLLDSFEEDDEFAETLEGPYAEEGEEGESTSTLSSSTKKHLDRMWIGIGVGLSFLVGLCCILVVLVVFFVVVCISRRVSSTSAKKSLEAEAAVQESGHYQLMPANGNAKPEE